MKEEYLHFAFKQKRFGNIFTTATNKTIEVIDFGEHNPNAGPDFLDTKIKYDGALWSGAIEFHVNASDWYAHNHQKDPAYNAVIAHFVLHNNQQVKLGGFDIPTVELKTLIDAKHYAKYKNLARQKANAIPCSRQLNDVGETVIENQKEEMIRQRLWQKSLAILHDLERYNGDRKKAFWLGMARIFGGKINALPFQTLVEKINLNWVSKLNHNQQAVDGLLLGTAGLIPKKDDEPYCNQLKQDFEFLAKKWNIQPLEKFTWKYATMRPYAFPDIKLAQFATLLNNGIDTAALLKPNWNPAPFLDSITHSLNPYWQTHFVLGKSTKRKSAVLSKAFKQLILINVVIPYQYAIGLLEGNNELKIASFEHLKKLPPEKNRIIEEWGKLGLSIKSAFDSQSLLAQQKERCNQKKCLFCGIGKTILQT